MARGEAFVKAGIGEDERGRGVSNINRSKG